MAEPYPLWVLVPFRWLSDHVFNFSRTVSF